MDTNDTDLGKLVIGTPYIQYIIGNLVAVFESDKINRHKRSLRRICNTDNYHQKSNHHKSNNNIFNFFSIIITRLFY